ncbi:MAG: hypothetical protein QW432_00230 [Desulfurococcaceae archaeon]
MFRKPLDLPFGVFLSYSVTAVSVFTALLGAFLGEFLLVECGFKVFTTLLVLKIITSKLKTVFYTATLMLILLLLFYTSATNGYLAVFVCVLSCVLVSTYSSKVGSRADAFLVLFSWCSVATGILWLSVPDTIVKYVLIPVILVTAVLPCLKCVTWRESRLLRVRFPQLQGIETWLARISSIPEHVHGRIAKTRLARVPRWKPLKVGISGEVAKILNKLSSPKTGLLVRPVRIAHAIFNAMFEGSVAMETYVNSLVGSIVALLIGSTTRFSTVERRISNIFHAISLHVERLQHEVERALLFLLSLMSILLLAAIIFYILYTTRLAPP